MPPSGSASSTRRIGGDQYIARPQVWRPGRSAPWAQVAAVQPELSVEDVLGGVARFDPDHPLNPPFADSRPAAVLIALLDGPHGAEVLVTRRSRHLSHHRGEMSFPGGRIDVGESPLEAALREAREEVGLDSALVEARGGLDHLNTLVSRSYIVPIVGRLTEQPVLTPSPSEVERILFVPLADLARPGTHREERWGAPPNDVAIQFFELDDETIWGATGRMLFQLLCLAYRVDPGSVIVG